MLFSSLTFLLYFIPLVMGILYCLPSQMWNPFLVIASFAFYSWLDVQSLWLLLLEILIGYGAALWMEKVRGRQKKGILIGAITIICAFLFWFKYANPLAGALNQLGLVSYSLPAVALPLGISFFTFQILSYLIDVYRNKTAVQKNFWQFALYVSLFCQLIAGPIVRYTQIESQLNDHPLVLDKIRLGSGRFVCGLAKKVLLANQLASFCQQVTFSQTPSVGIMWLQAIATALFIYYDFSGYTDMAIGLGHLMGFSLPENFRYPFLARNFTDFWRRWHICLMEWFRDYVYIPLGGNRKGRARHILALFVVWILTGLWHGAQLHFILWGLLFFVLLCLEKFVLPEKVLNHWIYRVFFLVVLMISFQLFQAESLNDFYQQIQSLFGLNGLPVWNLQSAYMFKSVFMILCFAFLGCFPTTRELYNRFCRQTIMGKWLGPLFLAATLVLCIAWLTGDSFNPFLYFRF